MNEKVLQQRDEIRKSSGQMILNRFEQFKFSKNIFDGNVLELAKAIAKFNGTDLMFNDASSRQQHRELNRHLHNFLASAKTLVEHTRIFVNENYGGTQFKVKYEEKIKTIVAEDPLCKFVQDLRNFILHSGIPYTGIRYRWHHEDGERIGISLDCGKLLTWKGWTGPARNYLESSPAKLEIRSFLLDYVKTIDALQSWIFESLNEFHKDDLSAYVLLVERYNRNGE